MQYNDQYSEQVLTKTTNTNNNNSIIASADDYNNNNILKHGAGRFMTPEQCEAIKTAYLENVSDMLPGAVAHMIERAFKSGLEVEEIVMAIEETGFAPKPSPWYLKAILENWVTSGVTVSRIRHEHKQNQGLPWWK